MNNELIITRKLFFLLHKNHQNNNCEILINKVF